MLYFLSKYCKKKQNHTPQKLCKVLHKWGDKVDVTWEIWFAIPKFFLSQEVAGSKLDGGQGMGRPERELTLWSHTSSLFSITKLLSNGKTLYRERHGLLRIGSAFPLHRFSSRYLRGIFLRLTPITWCMWFTCTSLWKFYYQVWKGLKFWDVHLTSAVISTGEKGFICVVLCEPATAQLWVSSVITNFLSVWKKKSLVFPRAVFQHMSANNASPHVPSGNCRFHHQWQWRTTRQFNCLVLPMGTHMLTGHKAWS